MKKKISFHVINNYLHENNSLIGKKRKPINSKKELYV